MGLGRENPRLDCSYPTSCLVGSESDDKSYMPLCLYDFW